MMAKKKMEDMEEKTMDRKGTIRKHIIDIINEHSPEVMRSFNMNDVMEPGGTRGLLRQRLPDLKHEEKKIFNEVLQDLKNEKILFHKTSKFWARLK